MQEEQLFRLAQSRQPFPVKLYAMLELVDMKGIECPGCSWLPHGRAFKVDNEQEFMEVCVPMFFKQTKIRSFYRQLNLWGFKRMSMSIDAGAWYNDFFLRGAPLEMNKMVRIKIKGTGKGRQDPSDKEEPNFYRMPPLLNLSKSAERLLRNRVGPRRVTTELALAGPVCARESQFNCDRAASLEGLDPPLPAITPPTCAPSPPTSSIIPMMVRSQPLTTSSSKERQYQMVNCCQPTRIDYPKPSLVISPGIKEAKFSSTADLDPLPFRGDVVPPSNSTVKGRAAPSHERSPIDHDIPLDEFARYIDDVITLTL